MIVVRYLTEYSPLLLYLYLCCSLRGSRTAVNNRIPSDAVKRCRKSAMINTGNSPLVAVASMAYSP